MPHKALPMALLFFLLANSLSVAYAQSTRTKDIFLVPSATGATPITPTASITTPHNGPTTSSSNYPTILISDVWNLAPYSVTPGVSIIQADNGTTVYTADCRVNTPTHLCEWV